MEARDPRTVLEELRVGQMVVCDGAMGTMLHAAGVPLDGSLPELNLSRPALVRDLHAAYVSSGAQIVQTNTFGANRLRLAGAGLEGSVSETNIAGARLAREAAQHAGHPVLVAGSVGPAVSAPAVRRVPASARAQTLREQIVALCDWVDLLILETFGDLESLVQAVEIATSCSDLPVVAQLTFGDDGRTLRGEDPAEAAAVLSRLRVTALGANCTVGPAVLLDVVGELARATDLPVSVQPNAGVPHRLGRQVRYARNAAYFAEAAPRFVAAGATLLGGCCGTTPAHVRAVSQAVAALPPVRAPPSVHQRPAHPSRTTVRDGALVVIVPGAPSPEALTALCLLGPGATCGLSEPVDSPELVPRGVRQAERAIDLGLRLGRAGQPVRYDELGIYRLLCTIGDMQQLMGFARQPPELDSRAFRSSSDSSAVEFGSSRADHAPICG